MMDRDSAPRPPSRVAADAVRAELSKLWTLPWTWLTLAGTLAVTIILAIAFSNSSNVGPDRGVSALDVGVTPVTYSQAGFFILGVLTACSEYSGGQIRTTLIAVPNRFRQRIAAIAALVPLAFLAAALTVAVGVFAAQLSLDGRAGQIDVGLASRMTLHASVYLTLMTILSSAVGVLLRRALPAAAILLLYLLVVSPLLLGQSFAYYLPDIASYPLWFPAPPGDAPSPIVSWITVLAWTCALVVPSFALAQRRDT